jgi:hypothetical protein
VMDKEIRERHQGKVDGSLSERSPPVKEKTVWMWHQDILCDGDNAIVRRECAV